MDIRVFPAVPGSFIRYTTPPRTVQVRGGSVFTGAWQRIPFDCPERLTCVLCTHREDTRPSLRAFLDILKGLYRDAVAFPL